MNFQLEVPSGHYTKALNATGHHKVLIKELIVALEELP